MGKNRITPLVKMMKDIEDVVKLVEHQNLILRRKLENNPFLAIYLRHMVLMNSVALENTIKILQTLNEMLIEVLTANNGGHT